MLYYSKYRPQRIEDLDLTAAREALAAILKSNKFAHAYLFVGPKGTGKTSSARIVAKVLNCQKNGKKLAEPCNECETCRRITAGASLACMEMDAASNRGIDDIRSLRERVGLAPTEGRYTVYIIDEVHMLTTEAFNALLKTLEEPPEHAVFILCTTEPQKIPETVISRCTVVQFFKATTAEVVRSLQKAVKGEQLEVSDQVLEKIAEEVEGSFRDGMKLLEQLVQRWGNKISMEQVGEITGGSSQYEVEKLFEGLMQRQVGQVLGLWQERQKSGVDVVLWSKRLLEYVRAQLMARVSSGKGQLEELMNLAEVVDEAIVKMKASALPELVFEVMVVKWCAKAEKREADEVITRETKREEVKVEKVMKKEPEIAVVKEAFAGELEEVRDKWQQILAAVKPLNHSLEALLRSARPKSVNEGVLQIEAFYKFHKEQLEQERHRQKLELVMAKVLGGKVRLEIVLAERNKTSEREAEQIENVSGKVEDDELVKAAEEIFGL